MRPVAAIVAARAAGGRTASGWRRAEFLGDLQGCLAERFDVERPTVQVEPRSHRDHEREVHRRGGVPGAGRGVPRARSGV